MKNCCDYDGWVSCNLTVTKVTKVAQFRFVRPFFRPRSIRTLTASMFSSVSSIDIALGVFMSIDSVFFKIRPDMWGSPDKEGELKKRGHVVKNWKTRWFIVQGDHMFYFREKGVSSRLKLKCVEKMQRSYERGGCAAIA